MSSTKLPDPIPVTQQSALSALADLLINEQLVAVDTESNSLYAYREQVCLIQISTAKDDYLIDPLCLDDLSPLAEVFCSERVEKVFHAAEYDVICLRRDFGYHFTNLFDTMVAARILGREKIGLGSILESEFGVRQNKRYQRADWGKRPLPAHLLDYARIDTHYLIPLRNRFLGQLQRKGVWELACEDFARISRVNGFAIEGDKRLSQTSNPWRIRGAYDLTPQEAAVLFQLCQYRERAANQLDRPLFKVISNKTLLEVARSAPRTMHELSRVDGFSPRQVKRYGDKILSAVKAGLHSEPMYPPMALKHGEDYLKRVERLRQWRKVTAQKMGVTSDVVLPRDLLYKLAARNPGNEEELSRELVDVPWRMENYGQQILKVLSKGTR